MMAATLRAARPHGGRVEIRGGKAVGGRGGDVAVSGGNSYSGDGGALILQGGSSETGGTGGDVIVDAGESGTHEESKEGMIRIAPWCILRQDWPPQRIQDCAHGCFW